MTTTDRAALAALTAELVECRRCPRLVEWRERMAREKVPRFRDETYWARPVPGFGDPDARILLLGLAPAAHGGNRTGRVFTGDASGDFLFAALHAVGLADRPASRRSDDGLTLFDTYIAAAVRCAPPANKPTIEERDTCAPWLALELGLLARVRVIAALGSYAWDAGLRLLAAEGHVMRPKLRFGHGAEATVGAVPAHRHVPPQPAEYVHRGADATDARGRPSARPRAGGRVARLIDPKSHD